jgi:hypothetical protein
MSQSLDRLVAYYLTRGGNPPWLDAKMRRREETKVKTMPQGMLALGVAATVVACAQGDYQYDLLTGGGNWSNAGLKGKALKYCGHYSASRASLVERIDRKLGVCYPGWSAECRILFNPESKRYERRLVLQGPGGGLYRW